MKRPLLSLSIFSAVFLGIILFSVVFGGYSSLYRAQNRARDAKIMVTVECQKQLDLIPDLMAMVRKTDSFNLSDPNNSNQASLDQALLDKASLDQLEQAGLKTKEILTRINSVTTPLEKELISAFERSQVQLSQEIIGLVIGLNEEKKQKGSRALINLEKKFNDLEITVFYRSTEYNKEARYFNTRKSIFPGFLIAKLFKLEKLHIYEIDSDLFKPEKLRS
jgi:hypothetical protein